MAPIHTGGLLSKVAVDTSSYRETYTLIYSERVILYMPRSSWCDINASKRACIPAVNFFSF